MNIFNKKIISGNTLGLGNPIDDFFGNDSSFNSQGNILAIGAPYADTNLIINAGATYIITGSGPIWNQVQRLTGNTLGLGNPREDYFGWSTSFNSTGNILAIGAFNADSNNVSGAGAVYIFTGAGNTWNQTARLTGDTLGLGNPSGDSFGRSVSLNANGNILAIGAFNADSNNVSGAGAVYIFTGAGNTWNQTARLTGDTLGLGNPSGDSFGASVSLNSTGNILAVGAYNSESNQITQAGAVYIFTGAGNTWNQTARLTGDTLGLGKNQSGAFGYSISLNSTGNILAVGAIYETTYTGQAPFAINEDSSLGAVYIFTGSTNSWNQIIRLTGNGLNFGPQDKSIFGNSIQLNSNGNIIIIGSAGQNINQELSAGGIYIYSGTGWTQVATRTGFNAIGGDYFGLSVSSNSQGNIFAIGGENEFVSIFSEKSNQNILFPSIPTKTYGIDFNFLLNQYTDVNLPIQYTSSNTNVASIIDNLVIINNAGTSVITGSQSGDIEYNPVSVSQTLTVNKGDQTIVFNPFEVVTFTGSPIINLNATTNSNLPISYTSSNTNVALINGNLLVVTGTGSSIITASQIGNSNYNPAISVNQTLTVIKSDQFIVFPEIGIKYFGESPFNPNAIASSNLPVSYTISDLSIAELRSNFIYIKNTGITIVSGFQTGNQSYNSAIPVSKILDIKIFSGELKPKLLSSVPFIINSNNYEIVLTGGIASSKKFNLLDDEKIEVGFDKNKNYNLTLKNLERDFNLFKINKNYVQSTNNFINFSNLTLDLTDNIPQRTISNNSSEDDIAYITYRLDNTNNNKLKAFNIDFDNIVTGIIVNTNETPRLSYLPYTGENKPCYPYVEFNFVDTCTDVFLCAVCSEGRRIYLERGFGSYMDVPRSLLPFNLYSQILDYDSTFKAPGRYRILLNSKFFGACCCGGELAATALCGIDFQAAAESFESYCDITNYVELKTFQRIKSNDIIVSGARKSIIEYLEENFNILFLDRIYFPELEQKYKNSYFSGQINNTKGFGEGDELEIKQYYYPFRENFSSIFLKNSEYGEVNKKFIYSNNITGENYFSNQLELIQKINLAYNSSGIYSWIPLAYAEQPTYDFGPMLIASSIDDNNISIKSLKSGWLGRYPIKLNFSNKRKGTIMTYMLPKVIKLQGSDNLIDWEDIISTDTTDSINEKIKNISVPITGIPYSDERVAEPTEVLTTITVPIGTTLKDTI